MITDSKSYQDVEHILTAINALKNMSDNNYLTMVIVTLEKYKDWLMEEERKDINDIREAGL